MKNIGSLIIVLTLALLGGPAARPLLALTPAEELAIAEQKAREAGVELGKVKDDLAIFKSAFDGSLIRIADKDAEIKAAGVERDNLKTELAAARDKPRGIFLTVMAVICAMLAAFAAITYVLGDNRLAVRAAMATAIATAATFGISYWGKEYALYGAIGLAVLATLGGVWLAIDFYRDRQARNRKIEELRAAGVEHANVLPLIEKIEDVPARLRAKIRAVWYQETGEQADKLAAEAEGITVEQLAEKARDAKAILRATNPESVEPAIVIPTPDTEVGQ